MQGFMVHFSMKLAFKLMLIYQNYKEEFKKALVQKASVLMIITDQYSLFSLKIVLCVMTSKARFPAFLISRKLLIISLISDFMSQKPFKIDLDFDFMTYMYLNELYIDTRTIVL